MRHQLRDGAGEGRVTAREQRDDVGETPDFLQSLRRPDDRRTLSSSGHDQIRALFARRQDRDRASLRPRAGSAGPSGVRARRSAASAFRGSRGRRAWLASSARSTSASTSRPSALHRVGASPAGARRRRGSRGRDAEIERPITGRNEADQSAERARHVDVRSENLDRTRARDEKARQDSEERCLAGTVGPEQGVDRPGCDVERHRVEHDRFVELVDDGVDTNRRLQRRPRRFRRCASAVQLGRKNGCHADHDRYGSGSWATARVARFAVSGRVMWRCRAAGTMVV